ncbi:MAG: M23 family metallopeptidase [Candidatus Paceibacterota bacterium]
MKRFFSVIVFCLAVLLNASSALAASPAQNHLAPANCPTSTPPNLLTIEEKLILEQFSESFLQFSPDKCHFTNNQGISADGTIHDGYDFNCYPPGRPFDIWILIPLKIREVSFDPVYGNYIIATDLQEKLTFVFGHADKIYVRAGEITDAHKPLMKVGSTGNSQGVHLHLEILKNGFPLQLGDCVFEYYKTIYRKEESNPIEVIAKTMRVTTEQAQKYISLISAKKYPLNIYKLFALSLYEKLPFPFVAWLAQQNSRNFYNFRAYFTKQNNLPNSYLKQKAELNAKAVMAEFFKKQFALDPTREKSIEMAEKRFKANYFNRGFAASIKESN